MVAGALSTYREGSLHAALKALYTRPGDRVEEAVDGFVVDVVRDDELVEIQTASFASAARKLGQLVATHSLVLVHPIAAERWLVRVDGDGVVMERRRSPKRGLPIDLFDELVAIPDLIANPNFRLELVMIREEEIRGPIPEGARYRYPRHWWRLDRRLLDVLQTIRVDAPADLLALLPAGLPSTFATADIVTATRRSRRLAMRTAYCLHKSGVVQPVGRHGRFIIYETVGPPRIAGEPAQ